MDKKQFNKILIIKKYALAYLDMTKKETVDIEGTEVQVAKAVIIDETQAMSVYGAFEMLKEAIKQKISSSGRVVISDPYCLETFKNAIRCIAHLEDSTEMHEFIIFEATPDDSGLEAD